MQQIPLAILVSTFALASAFTEETEHPVVRGGEQHRVKNEAERTTEYWNAKAQSMIAEKLRHAQATKTNKAKNVILFMGDGMSVHTMTATRAFSGDASQQLSFEGFPYVGLAKTYCFDRQVGDSACTATACLGGVKANLGTVGVTAQVRRSDCVRATDPANQVDSMAKWAQDAAKSTGFVTTARVTHSSPAAIYAHSADCSWESDADVAKSGCSAATPQNVDIARQLIEGPVGKQLNVIMGGGRRNFRNSTVNDEEGRPGARHDGRDLIHEWLSEKRARNVSAEYVWCRKTLMEAELNRTDFLLGLFSTSHCPYHGDLQRDRIAAADPSLSQMTEAAIRVLRRNPNGFFLFVESGRIDMAHHETRARKSLEDTAELANAVQIARQMTSHDDTLIVVTSDHSHTLTLNGYAFRDEEITGLASGVASDGLPYTILSYANGPGYHNTFSSAGGRSEISAQQLRDPNFQYAASVPLHSATHGGDDVCVFASGPYAQHFSGNYEQSNIPAMMAQAAGIGPFAAL